MRQGLVWLGLVGLWFAACGGSSSSTGSTGTGGDGAAGNGSAGEDGAAGDGSPTAGAPGAGATSDGEAGAPSTGTDEPVPCDITLASNPCSAGICAGTPSGGYYCRDECLSTAAVGDACGDAGVCLQDGRPDTDEHALACFELDDCDYLTSTGCDTDGGESCVVVDFEPLRTACLPAGSGQAGDPCEAQAGQQCGPGLLCLGSDIEDGESGRCGELCRPGEALSSTCVECIALTAEFGTCAECNILDNPASPDCPAGTHCYPVSEAMGGVCVEFGPTTVGNECTYDPSGSCEEGLICLEQEDETGPDPNVCVEMCDLDAPNCALPDHTCNDIGVFDAAIETGQLQLCIDTPLQLCWPTRNVDCAGGGTCIGSTDTNAGMCLDPCDPTDGDTACEGNYACLPSAPDELFFIDAFLRGNGVCGMGCGNDADCAGETCLHLDGLTENGNCGTTCDPTADPSECPEGATCVATPEDAAVGACLWIMGECDPSATDDTCQVGTACTPLSGSSTEGICLPGCHVQNPDACDYSDLVSCIEKTGDEWHAGLCLGSPTPCDPIAQTGCEDGQTCGVLGGGAIGGQAFTCDDAGTAVEAETCAGDDVKCVEGLLCVNADDTEICRRPCDPSADDCGTGTCEDISGKYYLPAGTVGACPAG